MDDVIALVSEEITIDENGVERKSQTVREVFCEKQSVTRAEFFDGGRTGLNPSYMFRVFSGDYMDETTVMYNGKPYGVYRTYQPDGSDYIEIYVARKGGTNGKGNTFG